MSSNGTNNTNPNQNGTNSSSRSSTPINGSNLNGPNSNNSSSNNNNNLNNSLNSSNQPASKKLRYDHNCSITNSPSSRLSNTQNSLLIQNNNNNNNIMPPGQRPLVALLDGRDCSIEMPILKDIATVAFCDAQSTNEIHEKVLNEAQAALLYNSINLSREDLLKFKALKLIVKIGTEYDNIDVRAAAELNIAVCNVSGFCIEEVADSAFSMILNLYRRTHFFASQTQQKLQIHKAQLTGSISTAPAANLILGVNTPEQMREIASGCVRVRGQTLGIVGLGKIGTAVALRARVFGFNVCFYDPYQYEGVEKALGVLRCQSLGELLSQSDCVTLHCPFNESTFNMMNAEAFKTMRSGSFFVNTAHQGLVDEVALGQALKSGQLKAAGLDDFNNEAFHPYNGALKDYANMLLITPRTAFLSETSCREMREMAAQEVRRGLLNKLPGSLRNCVNKDLLLNNSNSQSVNSNNTQISNGLSNGNSNNSSNRQINSTINNSRLNGGAGSPSNITNSNNNASMISPLASLASNPLAAASLLSGAAANSANNPNAQLLAQLSCKNLF
jgi:C-terminal binding protein